MLLEADQSHYIVTVISIATTVMNVIVAALLIEQGAGIHIVKLGSSLVFALNPILINIVVRKRYKINHKVEADNSALKQRWDAFAQQLAMLVRDNTAIIILTVVTNTLEISVYTVYFMVIRAINSMIRALTNGVGSAFGNMLAKGETDAMKKNLRVYELSVYSLTAVLYSTVCVLITPFVMVYTSGINDVNYNRPIFGYVLSVAYVFFCLRIPYQNIVEVAGHFKQTKKGAYVEAIINLVVSVACGWKWGIIGVAIGMLVAMLFRTFQYAFYVAKHLIKRNNAEFLIRLIVFSINMVLIIAVCNALPLLESTSYFTWAINGVIVFAVSCVITFVISLLVYKNDVLSLLKKFKALK